MQSKRFRNEQFYVGDLVGPSWSPREPLGLGIILSIEPNRWDEPCVTVYWQIIGQTKEAAMDLKLLEQVLD